MIPHTWPARSRGRRRHDPARRSQATRAPDAPAPACERGRPDGHADRASVDGGTSRGRGQGAAGAGFATAPRPRSGRASDAPGRLPARRRPREFDLRRFEELATGGRELLAQGDAAAARGTLSEALELWRGTPLAEFAANPLARARAGRLEELAPDRARGPNRRRSRPRRERRLVGELEALVADIRSASGSGAQLMLALYRAGRQADALAAYRERGTRSSRSWESSRAGRLQELEQAILRQEPRSTSRTRARRPARAARRRHLRRPRTRGGRARGRTRGRSAGRGRPFSSAARAASASRGSPTRSRAARRTPELRVLWGRGAVDEGAPPYWLWSQALRPLGAELPELDPTKSGDDASASSPTSRPRCARRPGAAAVPGARRPPPADEPSLVLLDFLAGEVAEMHVAIVGRTWTTRRHPSTSPLWRLTRRTIACACGRSRSLTSSIS